jgi:cephalosporin-C deacetylase
MTELSPGIAAEQLSAFWTRTLEQTRRTPLQAEVEQVRERIGYHKFRITFKSLDEVPVRAYLGLPADIAPAGQPARRWPLVLTVPGYGGWEFYTPLAECQRGAAILQVYPRGMGESSKLWQVDDGAYCAWVNHRPESPESFYYQGAFTDMVRAIDVVLERPDIDAERVCVMGCSGGGQLALGLGAIDSRIKAVVSSLPALCDYRHNAALAPNPEASNPVFLNTWDYFEPVKLAPLIKAPTLLLSGGQDLTCLAETIQTVFDNLQTIKGLVHIPTLGHGASAEFYGMAWDWVSRYCMR